MSLYCVHFKWKEKEIKLTAKSLDLTHPYFVSIKDILLPTGKKLIIDPSEDDIRKEFGKANHIMIPFQSVILIEELPDEEKSKVMPFEQIAEDGKKKEDQYE
ncbi:MAG: DUF1820 family protein [Spirochaetes bacterium]|nr:DUF1820 family protein [Spirochaetota bacterium]